MHLTPQEHYCGCRSGEHAAILKGGSQCIVLCVLRLCRHPQCFELMRPRERPHFALLQRWLHPCRDGGILTPVFFWCRWQCALTCKHLRLSVAKQNMELQNKRAERQVIKVGLVLGVN